MDDTARVWTIGRLAEALGAADHAAEVGVERVGDVLRVTMREHGDLAVFLSVAGEQIVVSSLLWPVAEMDDPAAFNHFLLKAQKLVPLSNFAITEVDGREYYELIGELSIESTLRTILIELRVLAHNALDAAADLRHAFAAA
ncbi:YjfI family protein [Sphingomonas phyllosphaerae]|uniref:YjfI family protein n=1 Tax=Sphingomonas phyllosphaerae TaxID=257003 RepID=UPI00042A0EA7|nr:YjfI family protein [Sphingomonas phyllosphaerae]